MSNPDRSTACPKCGAPCTTKVEMRGGDHGWGTTDAERTTYRYATEAAAMAATVPAPRADKLIAALRHSLTHSAEWHDKVICGFRPEDDRQNWAQTVYLPVPLPAKDKSVNAAFDRYVSNLLGQETATEFDAVLDALSDHDNPCEDMADALGRIAALRSEIDHLRPFLQRAQAQAEEDADSAATAYRATQAPVAGQPAEPSPAAMTCQSCGGTGQWAPTSLGADQCDDCGGTGKSARADGGVMADAIKRQPLLSACTALAAPKGDSNG